MKKLQKWLKRPLTSWLLLLPTFRKSGGETVNASSVKKALAMFQPIFKQRSCIVSSQGRFSWKDDGRDYAAAHSGTSNGGEGKKTSSQPSYLPNTTTWDGFFLCFREMRSELADLLLPQRGLSKNESAADLHSVGEPLQKTTTSKSALTRPKRVPKSVHFSWFILKLFCPAHLILNHNVYSVRQKKRAHWKFCDGTLPIFRGRLEIHHWC